MRAFGRRIRCRRPGLMCYGIALALMHREKTGEGQEVSTSLLTHVDGDAGSGFGEADSEVE